MTLSAPNVERKARGKLRYEPAASGVRLRVRVRPTLSLTEI